MSLQCQKCSGVVYDRRRKTCGFCGADLPAEMLFTPAEIAALNRKEAEAEGRRLKRKAKEDAKDRRRLKGGFMAPSLLPLWPIQGAQGAVTSPD
jgi:hypothetical protein